MINKRTCFLTGNKYAISDLFRLYLRDDIFEIDEDKKSGFRGYYICKDKIIIGKYLKNQIKLKPRYRYNLSLRTNEYLLRYISQS